MCIDARNSVVHLITERGRDGENERQTSQDNIGQIIGL